MLFHPILPPTGITVPCQEANAILHSLLSFCRRFSLACGTHFFKAGGKKSSGGPDCGTSKPSKKRSSAWRGAKKDAFAWLDKNSFFVK